MTSIRTAALFAALALMALPARAQSNGTYTTGMGYTIEVTFDGDSLEVYEPANGKRSVYARQDDGTYLFTNPVNGISYTMEIGDDDTLIANKPGAPRENGTELRRVGSADAAEPVDEDEADRMLGVAQQYLARVQSDPDNAQAWSFCGFAALARAQGGGDSQVMQSARALRQIAVSSANPCSDAIPDSIWNAAN
ncbi:MAG: hypothetical protein FGM43_12275 [Sinobacteraceae bacterium]|nr:hypothetical protein [Nevskiaceae bacterium]